MSPQTGPRPPSWGGGRDRLLAAAREVFAEKGYARGGIREIAARAEVTDVMIYKHFGSKATLFEAATIEPFTAYISNYVDEWSRREPGNRPAVDETYDFLRGLYDVLHSERQILTAMMAVRQFDPEFAEGPQRVEKAFDDALRRYEEFILTEAEKRGYRAIDGHTWVRLIFGSVLSLAVHGDMLNAGTFPSPDRAIAELAEITVRAAQPGTSTGMDRRRTR